MSPPLTIDELDGLPTTASENPPPAAAPEHPNRVLAIDHGPAVAFMSPGPGGITV